MIQTLKPLEQLVLHALTYALRYFPAHNTKDGFREFVHAVQGKEHEALVDRAAKLAANLEIARPDWGKAKSEAPGLSAIFANLRFSDQSAPARYTFPYQPLRFAGQALDTVFAKSNHTPTATDLNSLYRAFLVEWEGFYRSDAAQRFELFLPCFLSLLERYTWCLPAYKAKQAPGKKKPAKKAAKSTQTTTPVDVALYDHALVSAAIAQALYLSTDETRPFALISGDLSGIQRYLFRFDSGALKGVAKTLRARSFFIQQSMETAMRLILDELGLQPVARVMNAGGRFLLLAPNTPALPETLEKLRKRIDTWMYEQFFGDLSMSLAMTVASEPDLGKDLQETLGRLNDALESAKLNRLSATGPDSGWQLPDTRWQDLQSHGVCEISGRFAANTQKTVGEVSQWLCPTSAMQLEMGRFLVKHEGFIYYPRADYRFFGSEGIQFYSQLRGTENRVVYWLTDSKADGLPVTAKDGVRRFIANYAPRQADDLMAFDEIGATGVARDSEHLGADDKPRGVDHLAVFKADVDNLGWIFSHGLAAGGLSLARYATLSRMTDVFFSAFLPELLRQQYDLTYTVYAGGDDMFLLGPWRETLDLSVELNTWFRRWCCENPTITLSAGMALIKHRYPIHRGAEMAEEALEKSKARKRADGRLKNAVTVFDSCVDWEDLRDILQQDGMADTLNRYLRKPDGRLKTGMLHRCLEYQKMWQAWRDAPEKNPRGALWLAHLSYDVARNLADRYAKNNTVDLSEEGDFIMGLMQEAHMERARIVLIHALYRNRTLSSREDGDDE